MPGGPLPKSALNQTQHVTTEHFAQVYDTGFTEIKQDTALCSGYDVQQNNTCKLHQPPILGLLDSWRWDRQALQKCRPISAAQYPRRVEGS
jgi:hypothetical protein